MNAHLPLPNPQAKALQRGFDTAIDSRQRGTKRNVPQNVALGRFSCRHLRPLEDAKCHFTYDVTFSQLLHWLGPKRKPFGPAIVQVRPVSDKGVNRPGALTVCSQTSSNAVCGQFPSTRPSGSNRVVARIEMPSMATSTCGALYRQVDYFRVGRDPESMRDQAGKLVDC